MRQSYPQKKAAGWQYGPIKDGDKKENPCCVPYDNLPKEQKVKDVLVICIVRALTGVYHK
jgi:hypothetical protein